MSPTARSLVELRRRGYTASVVEQTIRARRPGGRPLVFKRDCFGGDILAVKADELGALLVQACRTSDQADRLAKLRQTAAAGIWLAAGNRLVVWGWALRGPRGARKTWSLSETQVRAE